MDFFSFLDSHSNEFGLAETSGMQDGNFTENSRLSGMQSAAERSSVRSSKHSDARGASGKSVGSLGSADSLKRAEEREAEEKKLSAALVAREDEIERYLASLPAEVAYKDIMNVSAQRATLNQNPVSVVDGDGRTVERELPKKTIEEKFAKNLHYFCMLEDERRSVLFLPEEMMNVTRKYHTRDRYEHVCLVLLTGWVF
jgi:hypothetical protein